MVDTLPEQEPKFYLKLQNALHGVSSNHSNLLVKFLPCVLGRESNLAVAINQKGAKRLESQDGTTLAVTYDVDLETSNQEPQILNKLRQSEITKKIVISTCQSVGKDHLILKYNTDDRRFEVLALVPTGLNSKTINMADGFQPLKATDKLNFFCTRCEMPHVYFVVFPSEDQQPQLHKEMVLQQQRKQFENAQLAYLDKKMAKIMEIQHRKGTELKSWGNMEKETLKKYLLNYGFGRWSTIQKKSAQSCKILQSKPPAELQAYAEDFVHTLFNNLQTEKNELKLFLLSLFNIRLPEYVKSHSKDWGDAIQQRATPWAKRLQLLQRIQGLIYIYRRAKHAYLESPEPDSHVVAQFKSDDNLLNFLPPNVFYGQRPSVWWTLRHDIDLILGTYKYGYANYQSMRQDPSLSFLKTEQVQWQFTEFPNADNITRRLKKLVQIFGKAEYQSELRFDLPPQPHESSGLSQSEKVKITQILTIYGVPTTGDGKSDFNFIRNKMLGENSLPVLQYQAQPVIDASMEPENEQSAGGQSNSASNLLLKNLDEKDFEKQVIQNVERFIQRIRMVAHQMVQGTLSSFDPDQDGYTMKPDEALQLHKNVNVLHYVRRSLLVTKAKLFDQYAQMLDQCANTLPKPSWERKDDKALLKLVAEKGYDAELIQSEFSISKEVAQTRIETICVFIRDNQNTGKTSKKQAKMSVFDQQTSIFALQQQTEPTKIAMNLFSNGQAAQKSTEMLLE